MSPETKLIIDEISRRFTEHDLKWDSRFSEQESRLVRQIQDLEKTHGDRVAMLEGVFKSLDEWKSSIEETIDGTQLEVKKLSRTWAREVVDNPGDSSGVYAASPSMVGRPPSAKTPDPAAILQPVFGHHGEPHQQESGFGVVSTLVHSPVKGEHPLPKPPFPHSFGFPKPVGLSSDNQSWEEGRKSGFNKFPKVNFPVFDGEQPKVWLRDCLDYFELYAVEPSSLVRIARMHLVAAAKRWYSSVESQVQDTN
jgi:hypothetical protein